LQDILAQTGGPAPVRRGPGRPRTSTGKASAPKAPKPAKVAAPAAKKSKGRLRRRSPAQIAKALSQVVALLKSSKVGLRSEQIQKKLGMQPKEMPRVLKEGLVKKALKSKGQKRSTTYSTR